MELVFATHCDIDADIERALLYDKGEEAARLTQALEAGVRVFESWVLRCHGRMLSQEGCNWSAQMSAEYLEELPDIIEQIENGTGARIQAGVGAEPSEAVIAMRIAEERGGTPAIVLYTPDLSEEARKLDEMSEKDASALDGEPVEDDGVVGGADAGAPAAASGMAKAEPNQREPGEASQVVQGQLSPTAAAPSPPPSASVSSASAPSPGGEQPPQGAPPQGGKEPSDEEVLQQVGQVLKEFQAQLPIYEQMKQGAPQAYQAVMGMVQGMVAMAQKLASGDKEKSPPAEAKGEGKPMGKAEERLNPQSWHIHHYGQPVPGDTSGYRASSYVTQKGKYTAVPSQYTQYSSQEAAVQHLREVAARHARPADEYEVKQGVGPVFKGEVDPDTGEQTKVEMEPGDGILPPGKLSKLYDTTSTMPMSMSEEPAEGSGGEDRELATKSSGEEWKAIDDYNDRSQRAKDPVLKRIFDFARSEEEKHHRFLDAWLRGESVEVPEPESEQMNKDEPPAQHHHVVLPPGSHGVGGRSRSVKVVEPVTGKTSWHQVSVGQKLSGDNHPLSPRVGECPSADTPEKRAQDAGLVGAPTTAEPEPGQSAKEG